MNDNKMCGTCRSTKHDGTGFYCSNDKSERCTEYVRYGDYCDEWEDEADE